MNLLRTLSFGRAPKVLCLLLLIAFSTNYAIDEVPQERYFRELEEQYRTEYLRCTDDSTFKSAEELVTWKKWIGQQMERLDYAAVLKEYIEVMKVDTEQILPCRVILWKVGLEDELRKNREKREQEREALRQRIADSLSFMEQIKTFTRSPMDFENAPFMVERRFLPRLLRDHQLLTDPSDSLVVTTSTLIGARTFSVKLYITPAGKLYRYDIIGELCSADSLNTIARTDAQRLKKHFTDKTGEPSKTFPVGVLDIKKTMLSPIAVWKSAGLETWVGICRDDIQYRARSTTVVSDSTVVHDRPRIQIP